VKGRTKNTKPGNSERGWLSVLVSPHCAQALWASQNSRWSDCLCCSERKRKPTDIGNITKTG